MNGVPLIVDADVHNDLCYRNDLLPYLPKVWHEQWLSVGAGIGIKPYSSVGGRRKDAVPPNGGIPGSDPHFLLEHHMKQNEIDYAILTGNAYLIGISLNYDPDYANAVASAYNDWLIDTWLKVSPKFKGSILINHADPAAAAKEIDRMAVYPDMIQVITCGGSNKLYGQRFYHPIYEAAERNGLPVAVHPGPEGLGTTGAPTPAGYPTRYLEWQNIIPVTYMSQINSMVCEGVFERFPGLKFVAIEGGIAWLPHLMWRMDKNYKALRDQTPWLKKLPSEYIKYNVRFTTQPIEEAEKNEHLLQIFEMCGGEDTVMFSSDYPHWDGDTPNVGLAPFPKGMREKIAGTNALMTYGRLTP